jgi:hypothetical protein
MFLLSIFSWLACSPCKQLCADIAKIAEDECGYTITKEMISACKEQQSDKDKDGRKECRLAAPSLEDEWDCEELSIYFEVRTDNSETESEENDTGS